MWKQTVRDIMTRDVQAARADWPIERLAQFLVEHGVSGAPVLSDDGVLVGVVSVTDIARHDASPHERRAPAAHGPPHEFYRYALDGLVADEELSGLSITLPGETTVRDIMTPEVFTTDLFGSIRQAAEVMRRGRIHRLFVVDSGHVVGVVSALDLLKVLIDAVPVEAATP